jgi:hypothetical protein
MAAARRGLHQRTTRLGERLGVVGRHGDARRRPRSTVRATSVPGSTGHHRTPGGQDRVELRRDAGAGQARRSGTTWTSAAAAHLGQAVLGLHVDEHHVREPGGGLRSSSGRATPPPLITKTTSGSWARWVAAASTRSSDCDQPTLPAYITTVLPSRPNSAAVGVLRAAGPDPVGVDEVGDHPHLVGRRQPPVDRRSWRRRCPRSSESTVTASARR